MGCSRKVAVGRARKLDIVVCRHSRLYARSVVCGLWSVVCGLRAVDAQGWARSGQSQADTRLRARAAGSGRIGSATRQRQLARGRLAVCGVQCVRESDVAWVVTSQRPPKFLRPG
jgi:hypothetical protein